MNQGARAQRAVAGDDRAAQPLRRSIEGDGELYGLCVVAGVHGDELADLGPSPATGVQSEQARPRIDGLETDAGGEQDRQYPPQNLDRRQRRGGDVELPTALQPGTAPDGLGAKDLPMRQPGDAATEEHADRVRLGGQVEGHQDRQRIGWRHHRVALSQPLTCRLLLQERQQVGVIRLHQVQ